MSESDVGLMVMATRQKSARFLYGLTLPAASCAPGGANWLAGTTCAMVIVVSFSLSAIRLSHEEPNAGTANRDTRIHNIHLIIEVFIGSLRVAASIYRLRATLKLGAEPQRE